MYLIKIVGPNSNGPCHDLNDRVSVSIVLTLTLTIRAAPWITVHLRRRGRDGGTRLEQREWLVCSESRSLGRRGRQDLGQSRFSSVFWVSAMWRTAWPGTHSALRWWNGKQATDAHILCVSSTLMCDRCYSAKLRRVCYNSAPWRLAVDSCERGVKQHK